MEPSLACVRSIHVAVYSRCAHRSQSLEGLVSRLDGMLHELHSLYAADSSQLDALAEVRMCIILYVHSFEKQGTSTSMQHTAFGRVCGILRLRV